MTQQSSKPRWIVLGTATAGMAAAIIVVAIRYYELRKARAEAALAEATMASSRDGSVKVSPHATVTESKPPKRAERESPPVQPQGAAPGDANAPPPELTHSTAKSEKNGVLPAAPKVASRPRVDVATTHGSFVLELDDQNAPKTSDAFLKKVRSKSMDGMRLSWMTVANRSAIDKDKKAADAPMAANVRFSSSIGLRFLDSVPRDAFARRGSLCIDQRYGEDQAAVVITQVQGAVPGRFPFGRVVEGWEILDGLCNGHWVTKNGNREPRLLLMDQIVKIKTVTDLSSPSHPAD